MDQTFRDVSSGVALWKSKTSPVLRLVACVPVPQCGHLLSMATCLGSLLGIWQEPHQFLEGLHLKENIFTEYFLFDQLVDLDRKSVSLAFFQALAIVTGRESASHVYGYPFRGDGLHTCNSMWMQFQVKCPTDFVLVQGRWKNS